MTWDKEAIYDERVNPLMAQIIEICKTEKIPLFATFQLNDADIEADLDGPMFCTTSLPAESKEDVFKRLCGEVRRRSGFAALTITTKPTEAK